MKGHTCGHRPTALWLTGQICLSTLDLADIIMVSNINNTSQINKYSVGNANDHLRFSKAPVDCYPHVAAMVLFTIVSFTSDLDCLRKTPASDQGFTEETKSGSNEPILQQWAFGDDVVFSAKCASIMVHVRLCQTSFPLYKFPLQCWPCRAMFYIK